MDQQALAAEINRVRAIERNNSFFLEKPSFRPREWWQREAEQHGFDWQEVVSLAMDIISSTMLETDFERTCRRAEIEHKPTPPPKPRPTPQVTVDAVLYSLAQHGLRALQEPATIERLSRCDTAALARIDAHVAKLKGGAHAARA